MLKLKLPLILLAFTGLIFLTAGKKKEDKNLYVIETEYGNIIIKLYDETPLHKANFEKLVAEKFYDSTLFHRVIQDFMIQGGDPNSKNAPAGQALGNGGPNYTIPAEFVDTLVHKKGALCAARQGDQVNPQKRSSGSQFYIVHGSPVQANNLQQMENQITVYKKQELGMKYYNDPKNSLIKDKIVRFQAIKNQDSLNFYVNKINKMVQDSSANINFKYSEKIKQNYATNGGTPQLDGSYTVFGEVVEGFNVLDSIAKVQKDSRDRPLKDIRMTIKKL